MLMIPFFCPLDYAWAKSPMRAILKVQVAKIPPKIMVKIVVVSLDEVKLVIVRPPSAETKKEFIGQGAIGAN